MVDVFGDNNNSFQILQGPPGPRGPRGPNGIRGIDDLCQWMPNTILKNLQEVEEQGCFVITNHDKDIIKNEKAEIVEWISRSHSKINLVGRNPTKETIELPNKKGEALVFHKNLYIGDGLEFLTSECGFLCVTFRSKSEGNQILISNYDPDNPHQSYNYISLDAHTIFIN